MKKNDLWRSRRRLSGTTTRGDGHLDIYATNDNYDDYTWLVVVAMNLVYGACVLVAYTIPTSAPPLRVHVGRLGGLALMLSTIYVASHRVNLGVHESDACAEYYATAADEDGHHGPTSGYTLTEAIYLIEILAIAAIVLAHWSIEFDVVDVEAETAAPARQLSFKAAKRGRKFGLEAQPKAPRDDDAPASV